MKKAYRFITIFLLSSFTALGDELVWDYGHGWTEGFVLTIDSEKATVTFNDRDKKKTWVKPLNNAKNVMAYLDALLAKIPKEGMGQSADDGVLHKITLNQGGKKLTCEICDVSPPGSIFLNEGYPVERELKEATRFVKEVDGFLLVNQLETLKKCYFSNLEDLWWAEKHQEPEKPAEKQPATPPEGKNPAKGPFPTPPSKDSRR